MAGIQPDCLRHFDDMPDFTAEIAAALNRGKGDTSGYFVEETGGDEKRLWWRRPGTSDERDVYVDREGVRRIKMGNKVIVKWEYTVD